MIGWVSGVFLNKIFFPGGVMAAQPPESSPPEFAIPRLSPGGVQILGPPLLSSISEDGRSYDCRRFFCCFKLRCSWSSDTLKRKSDDIGWEYGELVDTKPTGIVKCKLCKKVVSGGINRLKQHIAHIKGNVVSCGKSTPIDQAKCKQALDTFKRKRENKRETLEEVRAEVNIGGNNEEADDVVEIDSVRKQPHSLGPMDQYARSISPLETKRQHNKL